MYKIIGADGKEYGPISAEQLRQWIAEGRANAQTRVCAEGTTEWKPLSAFPEFVFPTPGAPPTLSSAMPVASSNPAQLVAGPAIGLIVVAILYLLGDALFLLASLIGATSLARQQVSQQTMAEMTHGIRAIISMVVTALVAFVILAGALKMKKLENYGLAMTASILAMLPCSLCCLVGLPIGIWSVVVLSKPEVKNAFH